MNALLEKNKNMKPTYKLFVVDDDDFDNLHKDLPYMTKEKLKDSLGFANPKTNEAYVRRTGVAEIDDSTMQHELMELLVKTSPDEIDGIRYKKGGVLRSIVPTLLAFIPGIGPALSAASAVGMDQYAKGNHPEQLGQPGKFGDILGTAALAYGGAKLGQSNAGFQAGVQGSKAAGGGLLGQTLSGAKGMVFGTPATIGGSNISVINPAGAAATKGFVPATAGLFGNAGILGGVNNPYLQPGNITAPSGKLASTVAPSGGNEVVMPLAQGGQGNILGQPVSSGVNITQTGVPTSVPTSGGSIISKATDFLKQPQNVLGAGSLLGSIAPKTPQFQIPDSVEQLRSKIQSGGVSPLGQQAQAELNKMLAGDISSLQPQYRQLDEQQIEEQKQLDARYNISGLLGSGEHLAAKDLLAKKYADTKTDLASKQKAAAIQTALNVDEKTAEMLGDIATLDVNTAMIKYGASAQEVNSIRDTLSRLGISLLTNNGVSTNANKSFTVTMG